MQTVNVHHPLKVFSKTLNRLGYTVSGISILFLLVDSIMKVLMHPMHVEGSAQLGWSANAVQPIGIVLLLCTLLYTIPRTAIVGAVMLTAYLGGAVATMARIGEPFYFPVLFGVLIWVGLYMREQRIRLFFLSN